MRTFLFVVCLFLPQGAVAASANKKSFSQKLYGADIAHQRLHQSQILDELAATSSVSSTSVPSTSQHAGPLAATATLQIYPSGSLPTSPAPPSACSTALSLSLDCDPSVQLMGGNPFFNSTVLGTICTSACTASLQSYRTNVVSACGSYALPGPNNISYAPTLAIDTISGPYNQQCLKDSSTGSFCNTILPTYNTTSGVLGYPHDELCTSCILGTLQNSLQNPLSYSQSVFSTLQTALGTCGSSFDSFNVTVTASTPAATMGSGTVVSSSNLTYSPACYISGRNITTSETNNTCESVASQFSITAADVLLNNPQLSTLNCTAGFGSGLSLCLPKACTLYTVQANQTCQDVADAANAQSLNGNNNVTFTQLISFNPDLGNGCSNIGSHVGSDICISPHGGFPDLGNAPTDVSKPSATITATAPPPGQTAPGTTDACGAWYLVQPNNFCIQVVLNNTITLNDFLTLNPEVNANCTNLWAGYYYCVAPFPPLVPTTAAPSITANATSFTFFSSALPTPISSTDDFMPYPSVTPAPAPSNLAPGSLQFGCNFYYNISSSDNCTSVETLFGLSQSDFQAWNPGATAQCPTLTPGQSVCVLVYDASATFAPAPTNVAAGTITTFCESYYTVVSGDNCGTVEAKNNITDAQFRLWNPEINTGCTNLELAEAYCVAMGAPVTSMTSTTTTTTTTTTTSSSSTTTTTTTSSASPLPTNIAAGTWTNCTTYYTVVSGDSCTSIETNAKIAISDFLRWNPEVTTNCDIDLAEAYCINGPSPCETIYTVASGDFCFAIASNAGITVAQLMSLNPFLDANCDLQIGWNLCVAATT